MGSKLKRILDDSYFCRESKNNVALAFFSFLLAAACTVITYPGIWYSDSYARVDITSVVAQNFQHLLSGQRAEHSFGVWLTPTPSFFMTICKSLTGNIAAYTILQAFFFFFIIFLLVKRFGAPYRRLQYLFMALNPLIYCVSVYYEASIGCFTGIAGLILLLDSAKNPKSKLDSVLEFILLVLFSYVTFGYRANAFTILPVLLFYIIKCKDIKKIIISASIIIGFLFVILVPKILNISTMSSASAGFAWEILTVIQEMEPEKKEKYTDYLDEIGGVGSTAKSLETSTDFTVNGFLWGEGINADKLSAQGASGIVIQKYFGLLFTEPQDFMKVKGDIILKTLGMTKPLNRLEYDYNRYDRMGEYQFSDSWQRHWFVDVYMNTTGAFSFYVCHPWVMFLLSGLIVFFEWYRKAAKKGLYLFSFCIAVFYYAAYLINTQSFEIRYLYPSLFLCMILNVAGIADMIAYFAGKPGSKAIAEKVELPT